jgi:hypothetical protein
MLLSVGKFVFILDKRVEVVEQPNTGDWILVIKVRNILKKGQSHNDISYLESSHVRKKGCEETPKYGVILLDTCDEQFQRLSGT